MQIQPILGYFWAIFRLYQQPAPPPPFGSRPPLFTYPGSAPALCGLTLTQMMNKQKTTPPCGNTGEQILLNEPRKQWIVPGSHIYKTIFV